MVSNTILSLILAAATSAPLVAAHGYVAACYGDKGGNGTGIAVLGGVVAGTGGNGQTEVVTTTFQGLNVLTDGLGKTTSTGPIQLANFAKFSTLEHDLSGPLLPQLSNGTTGSINCIWHQVVDDGTGPINCAIDPTGTGKYSQAVMMKMTKNVPANNGQVTDNTVAGTTRRRWNPLGRRGTNVDALFNFTATLTAPIYCTGTYGNDTNVCLIKCANLVKNGPWGSNVPVQIYGAGAGAPAGAPAPVTAAAKAAGKDIKGKSSGSSSASTPAAATPLPDAPPAVVPAAAGPTTVLTTTVTSTVTVGGTATAPVAPPVDPSAAAPAVVAQSDPGSSDVHDGDIF